MQEPSPDLFLNAVLGYQRTAAIKAAVALDLFTAIAAEAGDPGRIAARTDASERGTRILCDYLVVQGFLNKDGGRYGLTPSTAVFLTSSSPASMGSIVDFMAAPEMIALWLEDPAAYVRNGGSVGLASVAPDNPVWVKFARAMVPFMAPVTAGVAAGVARWPDPPKRILDIAAGHGMFGIAIAREIPDAEVTAIDWQAVLALAQENAAAAGLGSRHRVVPGSAFEVDWGTGYDLVLLANFLHHFDRDTCIGLLRRGRSSLRPGGRVLAVEFVPNEDRISPPFPAMFSFMMLGSTPQGDAYTAPEFEAMGRAAGFESVTLSPLPPSPQTMLTFA
jgi:ubiquinone/menaquinone biosynthesis C-methylase UbiE